MCVMPTTRCNLNRLVDRPELSDRRLAIVARVKIPRDKVLDLPLHLHPFPFVGLFCKNGRDKNIRIKVENFIHCLVRCGKKYWFFVSLRRLRHCINRR